MFRKLVLAIAVGVLAVPLAARAQHDDEFDSDWGWIDQGDRGQVEEYDFEPGQSVTVDTFQEGLAPYGQWVTVGAYGRVWHPAGVAAGWRPYYYGSWQWTDEGWLWVSSEPWGWATYHYGRWAYDSFYGWVWVPGYQWAPAWVSWRFGGDFIGWAPLGPGFSVYVTNYPVNYDYWCFVPSRHFVGYPVHSYAYVGHNRVAPIFSRTQPAPPRATVHGSVAPAWGGPARPFVERQIGRPIAPVRVQAVASPRAAGTAPREGVISVFRPEAARPSRAGAASRSGAVQTPAPGRPAAPGAVGSPARPTPGGAPVRGGGPSRAAPARPAPGSGAVAPSAPPAPRSAPPAAAPRSRAERMDVGDAPGASSAAPRAAPPPRNYGGGGAAPARPSYGGGGGAAAAPARPSYGGGGGAAAAPARPSYGGGGGNRGGGNGHGGGRAEPDRR